MERNLGRFDRRSVPLGESRAAAVAVVVVPGEAGSAAVLLTRRASGLRRHGGQWAIPGGRLDPGETPEIAALRELEEEVGLALPPDAILGSPGRLSDPLGLRDHPRRGLGHRPQTPSARTRARWPGSTASRFDDLLDPENLVIQSIPQSDRPVLALSLLGTLIYAPRRRSCTSSPRWRCWTGDPGGPLRAAGVRVAVRSVGPVGSRPLLNQLLSEVVIKSGHCVIAGLSRHRSENGISKVWDHAGPALEDQRPLRLPPQK